VAWEGRGGEDPPLSLKKKKSEKQRSLIPSGFPPFKKGGKRGEFFSRCPEKKRPNQGVRKNLPVSSQFRSFSFREGRPSSRGGGSGCRGGGGLMGEPFLWRRKGRLSFFWRESRPAIIKRGGCQLLLKGRKKGEFYFFLRSAGFETRGTGGGRRRGLLSPPQKKKKSQPTEKKKPFRGGPALFRQEKKRNLPSERKKTQKKTTPRRKGGGLCSPRSESSPDPFGPKDFFPL